MEYLGIVQTYRISRDMMLSFDKTAEDVYKRLPDKITIFRGGDSREQRIGANLNWTLTRSVAERHAFYLKSDKNSIVYQATIDKNRIFDVDISNGEDEIIAVVYPEEMKILTTSPTNFLPQVGFNVSGPKIDSIFEKTETFHIWLEYFTLLETSVNFSIDSSIHGIRHTMNVLRFSLLLGESNNVGLYGLRILAASALFHDTRRLNDWQDEGHGARAADYYREYCHKSGIDFKNETYVIIQQHDKEDNIGLAFISESDIQDKDKLILLYKIFKDSDALDRFRLGPDALDASFLRTNVSPERITYCNWINKVYETET